VPLGFAQIGRKIGRQLAHAGRSSHCSAGLAELGREPCRCEDRKVAAQDQQVLVASDAARQSTATDRNHHLAQIVDRADELDPNSGLRTDDVVVVEGMNEGQPSLGRPFLGEGDAFVDRGSLLIHLRTERPDGRELRDGCMARHEDLARHADVASRISKRLGVIARAPRHDATTLGSSAGDGAQFAERAAKLE
jgi:hypothetical protein